MYKQFEGKAINEKYEYATFTGEALVTPIIINPTVAQIEELKLPKSKEHRDAIKNNEVYKPTYIYKNEKTGASYRLVELYFSCNPKENMSEQVLSENEGKNFSTFKEKFTLILSSNFRFGTAKSDGSQSILVMDKKLNSAWVPLSTEKEDAEKRIKEVAENNKILTKLAADLKIARKEGDNDEVDSLLKKANKIAVKLVRDAIRANEKNYSLKNLDEKTLYFPREGQECLTQLLYSMSNAEIPVIYEKNAEEDKKKPKSYIDAEGKTITTTVYEFNKKRLENFEFDAEEITTLLIEKEYDTVNELIFSDSEFAKSNFKTSNKQNQFMVFLGVNAGKNDPSQVYQSVYDPGKYKTNGTFTQKRSSRKAKVFDGTINVDGMLKSFVDFGMTKLSKDFVKDLLDSYGFSSYFQNSFEFKPMNGEVPVQKPKDSDDLPF